MRCEVRGARCGVLVWRLVWRGVVWRGAVRCANATGAGAHAHYIGKFMKATATLPDGTKRPLFYIDKWDFNWQGAYDLQQPITVHSGDVFHLECEWDNTAENQMVVDGELLPAQDVEWGDGTRDEMCLAIAYITAP